MENKSLITEVDILDEAKENFLVYAEEVLTDRAVPNAEDGLLSAQRKILWTMHDYLKMNANSKTKKSNSVVGSTLLTSYFHGDASCYGVLCKMSQEYLMRYPLVKGQGMLGTQENNDIFASSRYTEAKPSIYADLMFNDFKKDVVPLKETYNGEFMEPVITPGLFPNAICNGRETIGIALAHSSAPNNLTEVCNAIIAYINQGNLTIDELLSYIPGPDFPLGNVVINAKDVREAFATGKSKVSLKVRGDYEVQGNKIIFNTIPYRTYRNKIKEQIEKNIDSLSEVITDFDDESNLGQNKLVFTTTNTDLALARLFAATDLQTTVSYNMNYIVNGTPRMCSMIDLIRIYVEHQTNVLIKATKFDKEKAEARAHILEGLIAAVDHIDEVIKIIKASKDKNTARLQLIKFLTIDEIQANAILDMRLGRLTHVDKQELVDELAEKKEFIAYCNKILSDKETRNHELISRVTKLRDTYGDARRTKLLDIPVIKEEKEKIEIIPEDCVVVITESNLIKRIPLKSFKTQRRNSSGIKNGDDIIKYTLKTNTLDKLMIFSSDGKMYQLLVNNIPEGTNVSKGINLRTLIKINEKEKPMAYSSLKHDTSAKFVFFATKKGLIKKVPLKEYQDTKKTTGIIALNLREGDALAAVTFIEDEEIMLITKQGMSILFASKEMPISSRIAQGVKGITLREGDEVLTCLPIHKKSDNLAIIAADGIGKQISLTEFTSQNRGGKGVLVYKGELAGAALIDNSDELLITGDKTSIKISAKELPVLGRTAQGNILLKNNGKITSVAKV